MKSYLKITFFLLLPFGSIGQNPIYNLPLRHQADSMMVVLKKSTDDTMRMSIEAALSPYYFDKNLDSSIYFGQQSLIIANKLKFKLWKAFINNSIGYALFQKGNYISALQLLLDALKISGDEESEQNIWGISAFYDTADAHKARMNVLAYSHLNLAFVYSVAGNSDQQLASYLDGIKIGESINDHATVGIFKMNLARFYREKNKLDSGLITDQSALYNLNSVGLIKYIGVVLSGIGDIYTAKGNYDSAAAYYREGIRLNTKYELERGVLLSYKSMAKLFVITGNIDSAIFYAKAGIKLGRQLNATANLYEIYTTLSAAYNLRAQNDSAYFYLKIADALKDSLYNKQKINQFKDIGFNQQFHQQEVENQHIQYQNKIRMYAMLAGIAVFILIAFLLYRINYSRRKANELLQKQKQEIEEQKKNVEVTLSELKAAQSQLIQSEKMASLGELTAGIAHEIQNPLNFVNNFSEVNNELIEELKSEKLNLNSEEQDEILNDIFKNNEKINHHGKRADAIVKGMLQHSRTSTGKKELTDINALADEYLRLTYHGIKAKDRDFNATMKTHFDKSIDTVNIIPQDIGRVLLNLYNNAFYAVNEKKKNAGESYQPLVTVRTSMTHPLGGRGAEVVITISDNGNGIPQKIIGKIFQPFFTTKPTGEGTGLGLSLSYDIITKAHGGEIKVETKEGEGTEFLIKLPFV
jgi:two-component system NtrC family sensor kinase